MANDWDLFITNADAEFSGESYNGANLVATLSSLDARRAALDSSFEGYSAWSVTLHLAYCKWVVLKALREAEGLQVQAYAYPEGQGGFVSLAEATDQAWQATLEYLKTLHSQVMEAIRSASDRAMAGQVQEWGVPTARAVAWLCSHDSYHCAQIRNMGVQGLGPKPRVY